MFIRCIRFVGTLLIVGLSMVGAEPAAAQSTTADVVYGQSGSFTTNTPNNGGVSANSLYQPYGVALDSSNNLYVPDYQNSRVLFYPSGSTTATRVYGQLGSFTTNTPNNGGISANSLEIPAGLALDSSGNLYVADLGNNRVLFYPYGSTTAARVYGQGGSFTTSTANKGGVSANSLFGPAGVALDSSGNLYVVDFDNNRVLFYPSGSTTATRVYGQGGSFTTNTPNNGGISANSLFQSTGVALDSSGNLYVADAGNNRVLFYPSGSTTATRVYGQLGSFTTGTQNNGGISANSLDDPFGVALDSSGNLYVGDTYNSRVLFYPSGSTTATRAYGQGGSFTTGTPNNGGISANSLNYPDGVALDSSSNLYVADLLNNRVLAYPPTTTPGIYSPINGSTLTGNSVTFWWAGYPGATAYWLDVGKEPGGNNYYQSRSLSASTFSQTVNSLPSDGSTVYATWYYLLNGNWVSTEYSYTAFGASSQKGAITSPIPSTTLTGSSVAFTWTAGAGATAYWIDAGSSAGGNQYFQSGNLGNVLTTTVSGLPLNGSTVYVTLYSLVDNQWLSNQYTYTAYNVGTALGVMQTPTPGSTLSGNVATFTWSAGSGATAYWVDIGSTMNGNNYYQSGNLGNVLTTTVYSLPADGSQIYVTLWSLVGGQWYYNEYTYTSGSTSSTNYPLSFSPNGLAWDGTNFWITNAVSNTLNKVDTSGNVLGTFPAGTQPGAVIFDGTNVWVANQGANTVMRFNQNGAPLSTTGVDNGPVWLVFDGTYVWSINQSANDVTKISPSGAAVGTFAVGNAPRYASWDGNDLWVVNYGSGSVTKLSPTGTTLNTVPLGAPGNSCAFDYPNLWVEIGSKQLLTITPTGVILNTYSGLPANFTYMLFDGVNMWGASAPFAAAYEVNVSNGTIMNTYNLGGNPTGMVFDGHNIWTANDNANSLTKIAVR